MNERPQRPPVAPVTYEEHLRQAVVDRATIDRFLDPERPSWATFDPVTGYRLGNFLPRDGIDESSTISTYGPDGARTATNHVDRPSRIATYGDSFTQCHQVSDGETWQEYLAAHLGEPVRNFGVGGFGVYQAYRRMLDVERTERGSEYVILYVWGDDHIRSLLRCRHAATYPWFNNSGTMFHANFWSNVEMNLDTGELEECDNLLPTPESVYQMTDADWMADSLRDDLALRLAAYARGRVTDLDMAAVRALADHLKFDPQALGDAQSPRLVVQELLDRYAFATTKFVLSKAGDFVERRGKKLLVILFDPYRVMRSLVERQQRYDQEVVDFLRQTSFRYFDMNLAHLDDYQSFSISFDEYLRRYFIGHYNPAGNHFFAYSIKPTIVDWLHPKPTTYQHMEGRRVSFDDYLRG